MIDDDPPNPFEAMQDAGAALQNFAESAASDVGKAASQLAETAGDAASQVGKAACDVAGNVAGAVSGAIEDAKRGVENHRSMNFQSIESLQPVVNVVNEASAALGDASRTVRESAIPEVLGGALGATAGGIGSFAALYGLGTVGLSAAGMTSALAAAGGLVGGGMAAGVFVLAAPLAIGAGVGVGLAAKLRADQLKQEKERLYKEALGKHQAIIQALKDEADASRERMDYLQALNILLGRAVEELRDDLEKS